MEKLRVDLRVVFYRDAGRWVAHCLEMDILGEGKTRKRAFDQLQQAIGLQLTASMHHNNTANIFMPADAKYFKMFAAGKDIAWGNYEVRKIIKKSDARAATVEDKVVIDRMQSREYAMA